MGVLSCASSKHLQTKRFLDTLQSYLQDVQRTLVQLHMAANPRPEPFVDHAGVLRDSRTGRPINGRASPEATDMFDDGEIMRKSSHRVVIILGYRSFFFSFLFF